MRVKLPRCVPVECASSFIATASTSLSSSSRVGERSKRMRTPPVAALAYTPHLLRRVNVPGRAVMKAGDIPPVKSNFAPKKVLILSKITRFEFEKRTHKDANDAQLEQLLKRRGGDFGRLKSKHDIHHSYLKTIDKELRDAGMETRIVQRLDYSNEAVDWADCVLSAGGDGTFLLAASKIKNRDKPVIGINTDPQGSEGYMCLMRKLPKEHFRSALQRLLAGDFQWLFRQRIRITVTGDHSVSDVVELHDQQMNRDPATTRWSDNPRGVERHDSHDDANVPQNAQTNGSARVTVQLPVLALNEVFLGESLSSRVSYYEIQIDNGPMLKQKSSGLTVCTGTGSTSWYFNINKLTEQCVEDLLKIVSERCNVSLPMNDKSVIADVCTKFNQKLIFEPDLRKMAFSVRDPVFNATFLPTSPRGFADKISVKSRGYDAHLVVDGGVSYRFNDGSHALLQVFQEDALRTVIFR